MVSTLVDRGNVYQSCVGVIRHRLPIVRAISARVDEFFFSKLNPYIGCLYRTSSLEIYSLGPSGLGIFFCA